MRDALAGVSRVTASGGRPAWPGASRRPSPSPRASAQVTSWPLRTSTCWAARLKALAPCAADAGRRWPAVP